nr:TonB-dependent receptor [Halomonas socia]
MPRYAPLVLTAAAAMSALSHADDQIGLPTITVQAEERHAPLQASAEQEQERLQRVPGGTNLVEPQKETRLATLRDALDHQPGIVIQDFFGGIDQPRLNIRGSGIQSNPVNRGVLLLQDGLPLNEADGSFIIGLLEPRDSALISVRRGANATTPGATSLGGELDFQSLTGADEAGRVRLETGSFGRRGWQAALGGQGGSVDGRISVSGDRYDGYRRHSDSERDSLRANLGFRAGNVENRSYFSWTDLAFDIPHVVPKERIESDPRGVMGDGDSPQDRLLNVYQRDPHRKTEQWRLANRSRWGDERLQQELGVYVQDTDDRFNNPTTSTATDTRTLGAQWQLDGDMEGPLSWRLGLAWSSSDMDRTLHAVNPQNGQNLQRFGDFDLHAENRHFLAGLDWQLSEDWTLTSDFKWGQTVRDAEDRMGGASLDQSWNYATPKLGVNWTPAPGLRWFANVSRSQEAPTFWEIVSSTVAPNDPASASTELVELDQQRATTFEIGGQGRLSDALRWDLSIYRSRVEDELISTSDPYGIKVGTYNYAGKTRHQGVEAGLNGTVPLAGGNIGYRAAWTYSDFRFIGGEFNGNRIAGVPRHLISAEALYHTGAWRFGPNLRWLPQDTMIDHANTAGAEQEAYALFGFKVDYQAGAWRAYLQGDNLTDERYASSYVIRNQSDPDQPGYLPGNGRSVSAGIAYHF